MDKLNFRDFNIKSSLRNKKLLKKFLRNLFKSHNIKLEKVDLIFCSDKYIRSLNKKFLNHNYNTDTITFILSDPAKPIQGESYISIDSVKKNAELFKIKYQNELIRVILHSCLHLCGFNDKTKDEFLKMQKLQENYLKMWNVSRETQIGD